MHLSKPVAATKSKVLVKTEPIDTNEGLRKGLSSPIVISSSEDEELRTPKAKPGRVKNFRSSLTRLDFSRASNKNSPSVGPAIPVESTPNRKGKGKDSEEPVVDLPSYTKPLSDSTVYLEDM